jgi:signal transduction histidine kinase
VTALGEKRHSGDDHDIPPLFTIAIIDPNLRVERYDLDGLQVARALAQTGTTRIIIMSGEPSYVRKIAEYGDLLVHGYLAKPFTVERLIQEIESAFVVEAMPLTEWLRQTAGDQGGPHDNEVTMRSPVMPPVLTSTTTMKQALDRLTHSRPGSVAHIFQLHPRSLRSRSLEHSGEGLDWEPLCGKIGKSIIKDAAFSATDVVSSPFSEPDEHLWTLQMMKYGSFCGTAVNAPGPYRYALVAFHSNTQPFDSQFLLEAHLCAEKVGRILERRDLARTRDVEASYTATGMALESLAHEMHTDFLTLQHQASMVIGSVIDPAVPNSGQADESRLWAGRLMSKLLSTQEKVNVLWGRRGKKEKVSVQECIRRAAQGCLAAIAATSDDPSRIDIAVPDADEEERWIVRASPGALVIVFFNLYLNAAQQIALSSQVRRFGRVWHTIERREDAGGHPCALVRIHDTGPGIHPDDWERIFERGYSTRPDGTGIGLSICRHLVASGAQEKGRPADIRVTRSTLWDGTTITVRLPLQDTEPGGS